MHASGAMGLEKKCQCLCLSVCSGCRFGFPFYNRLAKEAQRALEGGRERTGRYITCLSVLCVISCSSSSLFFFFSLFFFVLLLFFVLRRLSVLCFLFIKSKRYLLSSPLLSFPLVFLVVDFLLLFFHWTTRERRGEEKGKRRREREREEERHLKALDQKITRE